MTNAYEKNTTRAYWDILAAYDSGATPEYLSVGAEIEAWAVDRGLVASDLDWERAMDAVEASLGATAGARRAIRTTYRIGGR